MSLDLLALFLNLLTLGLDLLTLSLDLLTLYFLLNGNSGNNGGQLCQCILDFTEGAGFTVH
jgi:hypothetical protein